MRERPPATSVIKVGGSLLRDESDYRTIARCLRPELARGAWVVVSAAHGVTDELEDLARDRRPEAVAALLARHDRLAGTPLPAPLRSELMSGLREASVAHGTILAWGERASAAALQSRLSQLGVHVRVAELPWSGLPPIRGAALVAGFYVRDPNGGVSLMSRGGSDISAVLLAVRLHTPEVRLWKSGGGIHTADATSTIPEMEGFELLERLGDRIRPLHPSALRLALRCQIELILEDPTGAGPPTRIRTGLRGATATQAAAFPVDDHARATMPVLELVRP